MTDPATTLYARLEERVLARDQKGASDIYYDIVRAGRPAAEVVREFVRIHAPYTHVPYHQRLDDGQVKFVNNDHCLLSSRASAELMALLPESLRWLPLAQTIWYIPTGLDPWNQLLGKAPGHYVRLYELEVTATPPPPQIHIPDQTPIDCRGEYDALLNDWLTLVQRGEVAASYRLFLGLLEDEVNRPRLLAQLAFAGLIDVQDRMFYNRSYTTGHKGYRARATIALGERVGWKDAHPIVYAGVPDMAVGPRWHSTYEMACNVSQEQFEGRDAELLANDAPVTDEEAEATVDVILHGDEPAFIRQITSLLRAGRGPRRILDVIQIASAQVILETGDPKNFSMPQHGYEYCNTVRWFYDTFTHRHQLKLLYVAASFVNRASHHQADTPGNGAAPIQRGRTSGHTESVLLERLETAILGLGADEAVQLTADCLDNAVDRARLVTTLATAAAKIGNDPHNQELGLGLLEDYLHSTAWDRDRLLLAQAKHSAGHRKYGDHLEATRRFADALGR
jgi:hypothetical protein